MVTYSVGISSKDYAWYVDMLCDVSLAMRYVETGSIEPKLGDYKYVTSFTDFLHRATQRHITTGKVVKVAFDTETEGLDPYDPTKSLIAMQVSMEAGTAEIIYIKGLAHQTALSRDLEFMGNLETLFNYPGFSLRMANGKFDVNWVHEKFGVECTNFKFDTLLVGSLCDENRANDLGTHAKIYTPLGGYCVAPSTRLWKADLSWTAADQIKVGDKLVGFDEHTAKPGSRRTLQESEVLSTQALTLPCWRVTTTRGKEVVVSANHAWLCNAKGRGGNLYWTSTDQLYLGQRIKSITDVVQKDNTFEGGWVSGFLDGEGHLYRPVKSPRLELGWAQLPTDTWDKSIQLIGGVAKFNIWDGKKAGVMQAKASTWNALKILQAFRPARLLAKGKVWGISLPQEEPEFIANLEYLGEQEVVSLKTSTHTFVAEGLASHNSDAFDRVTDKSKMREVPMEPMRVYAGADADATLQVAEAETAELAADRGLARFYINLLHPAARAYEHVERTGVYIDKDAFAELDADLQNDMANLRSEAKKMVGGILVARHAKEDGGDLNIIKPRLVRDFMFSGSGLNLKPLMFTEKSGEPSTAGEHLQMFKDHPKAGPYVKILSEYSAAAKTRSTYVTGFLSCVKGDGRFHPHYFLHRGRKDDGEGGTNTGRLSCIDPAFQTIPKHTRWAKRLRKCYIAPPGYVIVGADYSQGELRVIACLAGEPTMIAAYSENMDLHALTSGRFSGYTYEQMMALKVSDGDKFDAIRQLGKAGNFGLIYGMGAEGFWAYAEANYGVKLSLAEATAFRDGFFNTYPVLLEYHHHYKAFARQHGFVRNPLGRVRHLPLINSPDREVSSKTERQSINSPVQSTLSDLSLLAAVEFRRLEWHLTSPLFGMVHDQNLWYVPEDIVTERAKGFKDVMENLPLDKFGWTPQLKFIVDVTYGPNLAEQKKLAA